MKEINKTVNGDHQWFVRNEEESHIGVGNKWLDTRYVIRNRLFFYKGIIPCFLYGLFSDLVASTSRARAIFIRVSRGSMTSSI